MTGAIRIPLHTLRIAMLVLLLASLVVVPQTREGIVAALGGPVTVADDGTFVGQRVAVEKALARGFAQQVEQLSKVRELRLPISDAEASARTTKALEDLRSVRREALGALADVYGMDAPGRAAYVASRVAQLDAFRDDGSSVLLAPRLMAIVARADQLYAAVGEQAVRDLTAAPKPSPSPRP